MTASLPGTWTVPGYRAVRELGRGATGTVFLAVHEDTDSPVAIKYLADDLFADGGFREDFRAEAETLATVADPHVVRLWEYVECDAGAAIVMDLVDGVELKVMLEQQGPTEPESALWVLQGSLRGLATAHARGVVHRDYKPANVLVTREGQSLLTDFGIAGRDGADVVTAGTPLYMAPEQWSDGAASVRSDLYAATASFVECLTGRPPYPASDPEMLRRQHEHAPIPLDDVPPAVRGLVARGLAKRPEVRPVNAAAFLGELQNAAVVAYGPDWEERGRSRLAHRAALLALLFPLSATPIGASALAQTDLGAQTAAASSRLGVKVLLGAAAAALVIGGAAVALSGGVPAIGLTTSSTSTTLEETAPGAPGAPAGAGTPAVPGAASGGGTAGAPAPGTAGRPGAPGAPGAPAAPAAPAGQPAPAPAGPTTDPAAPAPPPIGTPAPLPPPAPAPPVMKYTPPPPGTGPTLERATPPPPPPPAPKPKPKPAPDTFTQPK